MPRGIPYILANEVAERFSYFGMDAVLIVFMTTLLTNSSGELAVMSKEEAKAWFHLFASAIYFIPLFGALLADGLLGKYKTILSLSCVYCLGHLALAADSTRTGLVLGLSLIAVGAGGIKPNVASHLGDQFGSSNSHLLPRTFGWFYLSISVGALVSTLLTPWLLEHYGPHAAFGVPGLVMLLATLAFWLGRYRFIHVPPGGMDLLKENFSLASLSRMSRLLMIYPFLAIFWSLLGQTGSAFVLQAQALDRTVLGITILPAQVQSVRPLLILASVPFCNYLLYPLINRYWTLTPLRKIGLGLFGIVPSFLIPAWVEVLIARGQTPGIAWHLLAFVIMSLAEVFAVVTLLEFSYSQAPKKAKSLMMAALMLSTSLGNLFASLVNVLIMNPDGSSKLAGAAYYLFFAGLMTLTVLCFIPLAMSYREPPQLQDAPT
jgi:POT family proton-dependent oligopeptide transporter